MKVQVRLTPREKEIISLAAKGKTYDQIRGELGISYETVCSHLKMIRSKMNVSKTFNAVAIAKSEGLISS